MKNISKLNIDQLKLEEIDLSLNELITIPSKFFKRQVLTLKVLNLKKTNIIDWKFLFAFHRGDSKINEIDLSYSKYESTIELVTRFFPIKNDKVIKLSNTGIDSLDQIGIKLLDKAIKLDVNHNNIDTLLLNKVNTNDYVFSYVSNQINYLDISFNNISTINNSMFIDKNSLKYINLESSLNQEISSNLYWFNDYLETAILANNYLNKFPIFCSYYSRSHVCNLENLNLEGNKLEILNKEDLIYLKSLKYLNLNRNLIQFIENNTFDQLINLEKLYLSGNRLSSNQTFNPINSKFIFKYLFNLKELNLSYNCIEFLNENLFFNLNKLTTIDLSNNLIKSVKQNSFNRLFNLKNLYLQNNSDFLLFEAYQSFNQTKSIKNIFISKSILYNNEFNKCFFKQLFIDISINNNAELTRRSIQNRIYYNSLNINTIGDTFYDCELVLSFSRYNIHFNLKSDLDFYDYMANNCENLILDKSDSKKFYINCDNF